MMRHLLALAVLLTIFFSPAQAQEPDTLSLDEYRASVAQSLRLAEQAAGVADRPARAALLQQAADRMRSIHTVTLSSGERVAVDGAGLATFLSNPDNAARAVERLQALQAALREAPAQASASDLDRLRGILSNPPFVDNGDNWLLRLLNQIEEWLFRLFGNAVRGVYDGRDLVTVAGLVGVGIVLTILIRNLRRNVAADEAARSPDGVERSLTSGQALRQAQSLATAGDYRAAVRQLYLATLLLLDERRLCRYDRSLTNREYLRAVAGNPAVASGLAPIVQTFDRVWYGFERINAEDFQAFAGQVEAMQRLALLDAPRPRDERPTSASGEKA